MLDCCRTVSYLDVGAGGEPGLVGQHLVDVVQEAQARGRRFQTLQPQRVSAHPQELGRVQVHQVVAVMSCGGLKTKTKQKKCVGSRFLNWKKTLRCSGDVSLAAHHDGDIMAVRQRQGAVHVQDVVLCVQEALQVLRVRRHLLRHGVHAAPADQFLHDQQRDALLLSVHHHLQTGNIKTVSYLFLQCGDKDFPLFLFILRK